jgi:uncharacterized protein YecE (DUF72 family)
MPQTRIGISGWRYAPWRGVFYPKDLPQKRELEFAASVFNSIEINGSFYSLQRPSSYADWYDATPEDFVFAVKGGRYITHMKKLAGVEDALANFLASGVLRLREKLGPFLWQLPPFLAFDEARMAAFCALLPNDMKEAAALARRHTQLLKGRSYTRVDANRRLRHAFEVRHPSFLDPNFIRLLRKHNFALVLADTAKKFPYTEDVTADFIYIRLHGSTQLYASGYTPEEIAHWAQRIKSWQSGGQPADAKLVTPTLPKKLKSRDVYLYCDNDAKVRAPFDAMNLRHQLGGPAPSIADPNDPDAGEEPREQWPVNSSRKKKRR